jgi:hypothetical protein
MPRTNAGNDLRSRFMAEIGRSRLRNLAVKGEGGKPRSAQNDTFEFRHRGSKTISMR